jgi:hypothetical protein
MDTVCVLPEAVGGGEYPITTGSDATECRNSKEGRVVERSPSVHIGCAIGGTPGLAGHGADAGMALVFCIAVLALLRFRVRRPRAYSAARFWRFPPGGLSC